MAKPGKFKVDCDEARSAVSLPALPLLTWLFYMFSHTASLFLHGDVESLHSAATLLVCLLFAPVSLFPSPGSGMKLPEPLHNR